MAPNSRTLITALLFVTFAVTALNALTAADGQDQPPNVLFIAVDDLRPQLACYGREQMNTPNFDRLARRSVLFERAYCMVPTCGASRASLMTGLRPTPQRFVSYTARADKQTPDTLTLNTHFKNNGYTTISLGKIFHFPQDNVQGWSQEPWRPSTGDYRHLAKMQEARKQHQAKYPHRNKVRGPAWEAADAADSEYRDHQLASRAIEHLDQFETSDQPFFLAVGFFKPHLPFCAPKKYWDLYDPESIQLPNNPGPPIDAPEGAVHSSGELRAYAGIPPRGPVSDDQARQLIHGYYACVSFIDAQVGRLLSKLDETGLADNTIIVLWGDHGWQLGEHGMWNKHSCFETSMHAPLFVSAPGIDMGTRTNTLTEFIDIYPSLCQLAGLETPPHLQGESFVKLMKNPLLPGKPYAVGRFGKGDTLRSDRFRYSEYRTHTGAGQLTGKMLYDHQVDPAENRNVVANAEHVSTVTVLADDLDELKGK